MKTILLRQCEILWFNNRVKQLDLYKAEDFIGDDSMEIREEFKKEDDFRIFYWKKALLALKTKVSCQKK